MLELMGLIYGLGKDLIKYLKWTEEPKPVDLPWLEKSGLKQRAEDENIELRWSKSSKVESRLLEGYQIFYEVDERKHVRRKIIVLDSRGKEDLVLMGKPKAEATDPRRWRSQQ